MYKLIFYIKPEFIPVFHLRKVVLFCHDLAHAAFIIELFAAMISKWRLFHLDARFTIPLVCDKDDEPLREKEILPEQLTDVLTHLDVTEVNRKYNFDYISIVKRKTSAEIDDMIARWPKPKITVK
jgi:hypothetical protein